jgi:LPXTG-motif cell wall-anchored protein
MKKKALVLACLVIVMTVAMIAPTASATPVNSIDLDFDQSTDFTDYFDVIPGTGSWTVQDGQLVQTTVRDNDATLHVQYSDAVIVLKNQQLQDYEIEVTWTFRGGDADLLSDAKFLAVCTNLANATDKPGPTNTGLEYFLYDPTTGGPGWKQFLIWDNVVAIADRVVGGAMGSLNGPLAFTKGDQRWYDTSTTWTHVWKYVKSGNQFSYYFDGELMPFMAGFTTATQETRDAAPHYLTNDTYNRAGYVMIRAGNGYMTIDNIKITSSDLDLDIYPTPTSEPTVEPTTEPTGSGGGNGEPTEGASPNTGDASTTGALALGALALLAAAAFVFTRRRTVK